MARNCRPSGCCANQMPRRAPYTKVEKTAQVRAAHVRGMSDVAFRGFNCLNAECTNWIIVRDDEIGDVFEIECPACRFVHRSGEEVTFYKFVLRDIEQDRAIEEGDFAILVDDYLAEASKYKYCIVCNTLKPLDAFDTHAARKKTKRQGECRLCKQVYNSIKNQTRTADQHREAAQKRRLYIDLSGGQRLDSAAVIARFDGRCFKCGADLTAIDAERNLDHTLPAVFLWPLTTENATLLCRTHNSEKAGKWPNAVYTDTELRRLSALTGIPYRVLVAVPHFNPETVELLQDPDVVDALVTKYAPYMDELTRVRNRVLDATGVDLFGVARIVSKAWVRQADAARKRA
ncbi:MAG: HNH endonuclease [Acidimicrobiales bacterium]